MGHRSWLVEIKTIDELEKTLEFMEKADEICGYSCRCYPEVFCRIGKKLFFGFSSDGSTCGEVYEKSVLPSDRYFGLLGEFQVGRTLITPEYLKGRYLKTKEAVAALGQPPNFAETLDQRLQEII